jgi:hypothetical protein
MTIDPTAARLASHGVAFAPEIATAAKRHGLDPNLLAAVAAQETGGPDSNAGHNELGDGGHGHGLFQIDDRWHDFARSPQAMNPADNAEYAATMLSGLLSRYGGNVHEALSAYNSGSPTAVGTKTRWADGRDLGYADSVLAHYGRITDAPGSAAALAAGGATPPGSSGDGQQLVTQSGGAPLVAQSGGEQGEPQSKGAGAWQELAALIASLGALESPMLQPPSVAAAPQPYQPQIVDYAGLIDGNDTLS